MHAAAKTGVIDMKAGLVLDQSVRWGGAEVKADASSLDRFDQRLADDLTHDVIPLSKAGAQTAIGGC